jgi:hypothetical protein
VFEKVDAWLATVGAVAVIQQSASGREQYPRVWELNERSAVLGQVAPRLLLPRDFPLSPARIELDAKLCLRLPHIESDGSFCHGILPQPEDIEKPIEAVGRALQKLRQFLNDALDSGWIEAEFHRERQDYWIRHVAATATIAGHKTDELFLDIDVREQKPQIAGAISFGDGRRALATVGDGPEDVVKSRGWEVGTIVRGSALIAQLPSSERWTPSAWPSSFSKLTALITQITGKSDLLSSWYAPGKWSKKAPVFIVLVQQAAVFGWRLISRGLQTGDPQLVPIKVTRIDRQWCLSRDHQVDHLLALTKKSVVVFGCGSLGSPVVELLARAGVGRIEVADPDIMKPENVSRHSLGANAIGRVKVEELSSRINRDVPGANVKAVPRRAQEWLAAQDASNAPDLVLDCTGDRAVRISTSLLRCELLQNRPVMMAWMEPYCAAAHVVTITGADVWPTSDPAESVINIATWPDDHEVMLPGCGQGFHPYGMADVWRVAGLVAERAVALLTGQDMKSEVWSMIRGRAFFDAVAPGVSFNRELPNQPDFESVVQRRGLQEALRGE